MTRLGQLLIAVGFLLGSLVAVQTSENRIAWPWFLPCLALGVVGVGLARAGIRRGATAEDTLEGDVAILGRSLARIVERIVGLDEGKGDLHPFEVHGRIDRLFPEELAAFVEARESLARRWGLQAYAEVMSEFAAGERYLNRVWSASVDCYVDDVHEYLGRAREQFLTAQRKLSALAAGRPGPG